MKRLLLSLATTIVLALSVSAQQAAVTPYLTVEQMPDLIKCLPAPPAFDSPEFAYDMMRYAWGKQQRLDTERAAIARRDAVWSYEALVGEFAVPFGLEVTAEATPEIWKLLETSLTTTDAIRVAPKAHYLRQRPFERFQDKLLTDEEDELRTPSGAYKKQLNEPVTRDFIARLKAEPLLRCILAGHEHISVEDQFSPTCREYVTAGTFLFHGREVLFV